MPVWASLGLTPTEVTQDVIDLMALYIVLDRAWRKPFSIKSNFARNTAFHVAMTASEGLITIKIDEDFFGNRWMITEHGMETKEALDDLFQDLFARANGRDHTLN